MKRLWLVFGLLLPGVLGMNCQTQLRVVAPVPWSHFTRMPTDFVVEFDEQVLPASIVATLNDVDVSAEFVLQPAAGGKVIGEALDLWAEGLLIEGWNRFLVSAEVDGVVYESRTGFFATGDPHADELPPGGLVLGTGGGFGQGELPAIATEGPFANPSIFLASLDVISLGHGGRLVLEFVDNAVVDGPGPDFTVFENAFLIQTFGGTLTSDPFAEPVQVEVSQDGVQWFAFACAATSGPLFPGCAGVYPSLSVDGDDATPHPSIPTSTPIEDLIGVPVAGFSYPPGSGGDSYDLADVGLTWAAFVRLTDVGAALGAPPTVGADIDTVVAIHSIPFTDENANSIPDALEP